MVNSDHLAESTSVTRHSVSDSGVAMAGGLGLHAHDWGTQSDTVDINSNSQFNTHTDTW